LKAADSVRNQLARICQRLNVRMVSTPFEDKSYYVNIRKAITAGYFMQVRGTQPAWNMRCVCVSVGKGMAQVVFLGCAGDRHLLAVLWGILLCSLVVLCECELTRLLLWPGRDSAVRCKLTAPPTLPAAAAAAAAAGGAP
jgi:hypothetical protein